MEKYFLTILLGAFVLTGCIDDKEEHKEVPKESLTNEQAQANNNEVLTSKTEEVAPTPLNLTKEQKEEYYQQYVSIIDNINAENPENSVIELEPITAFLDEYWIEVEDFEKLAKERAEMSSTVLRNSERYNPGLVPKRVKFHIGSKEVNIIFKGSFNTQLNSNTSMGRQLFSEFYSISSEAENADGSWTQLGYEDYLMHGGVTYVIEVGGKYSQSGIISTHIISLSFNCDKNGGIS